MCLVAFIPMAGPASARARLSDNVTQVQHIAVRQAEHGQRLRALASLASVLMTSGVTIGMESPGAMGRAVEHGVKVWNDRLPGCPFRFSTSSKPAIKVRFVDHISGEGELQGRLEVHRYVRWGGDDASYTVRGTIEICDNTDGRPLDAAEVAAVTEHELGHLLGLDDEDEPGTLMGPFVAGEPCDGPSEDEVALVQGFRSQVRHQMASMSRRP